MAFWHQRGDPEHSLRIRRAGFMHIPLMFTYSHQGQLLPSVHLSYPYISGHRGNIPSMDCLSHHTFSFQSLEEP